MPGRWLPLFRPKVMILRSRIIRFVSSLFLVILLAKCQWEKGKNPVFISDIKTVENKLRKVIDFQKIKFSGTVESLFDSTYSLLTVEIIDPPVSISYKTIPKEDSTLREIGKQITLTIKSNLKDPDEFEHYTIKFTHKDHNWRNSSTTRNYVYKLDDL
jgi:hypothetical protein